VGVGRLGPGLTGAVDAERLALDLGADGAREDIREDEAGGGMVVRRGEAAGTVIHLDDGKSLARDIVQLLTEDLLLSRPFAARSGTARRGRTLLRRLGQPVPSWRLAMENARLALLPV